MVFRSEFIMVIDGFNTLVLCIINVIGFLLYFTQSPT